MSHKNVFISHYNQDEEHIQNLKDLVSSRDLTLRNHSIDGTKPNDAKNEEYIKTLLRKGIDKSGTVVVLVGPKTHTRWWIDWEIEYAAKQGKRIVGVYVQGASDSDLPESFDKYGDALVGWNGDRIVRAVNGENNYEKVDGTPRENHWKGSGSDC